MLCMFSYPRHLKSGHITCYLNRTYDVLTTPNVRCGCLSLAFFVRFPLATCTRNHPASLINYRRSLDVRRFPSLEVQSDGQLEFQIAAQLPSRRSDRDS